MFNREGVFDLNPLLAVPRPGACIKCHRHMVTVQVGSHEPSLLCKPALLSCPGAHLGACGPTEPQVPAHDWEHWSQMVLRMAVRRPQGSAQ